VDKGAHWSGRAAPPRERDLPPKDSHVTWAFWDDYEDIRAHLCAFWKEGPAPGGDG
jgi:hypothetical protein